MGLINYLGDSKVIKRICQLLKVTDVQDSEGHSLVDENGIAVVTGGGGGSSTLAGLSDVDTTGASAGDVLSLDGTSGKWEGETLATVAKSGSYNDLLNKPTKLSDFSNDTGFITNTVNNLTNYYKKSETYTQAEVDALISAVVTIDIEVVQTLPTTDISTTTIYLLPKQTAGTDDVYDEYINTTGTSAGWELIGSTQVDLSNYYTKSEVDALIGSVSGGHTIKNDSGIALADKDNLKFAGTYSSNVGDDSVVNILREMVLSAFNQLSADEKKGFIYVTDEADDTLADVAVTGEYSDLLHKPTALSDFQNDNAVSMIMRSDISTLADFVNLCNTSGTARGFTGNINITQDIGIGRTGWIKLVALSNNPPNSQYSLNLYCIFIPANTDEFEYAFINGTNGSYSVVSYGKLIGFGDKTFKVDRESSHTTSLSGYWAAMLHSTQAGSPVLPVANKWWHVLSMDWAGTPGTSPVKNWVSQLAIATQETDGVYYRKNASGGNSDIDNASWQRLAEGNSNGHAQYADGLTGFIDKSTKYENTSITYDFQTQRLYLVMLGGGAGSGSYSYDPSLYIVCCRSNNVTDILQYYKIFGNTYSITSATRSQTGTNKFVLQASHSVRWTIFPFLSF